MFQPLNSKADFARQEKIYWSSAQGGYIKKSLDERIYCPRFVLYQDPRCQWNPVFICSFPGFSKM
jgi:hypothetical protein